jgi:hypothetical protein
MSFKYYTKTTEELQESAKTIADNFAGIVGCDENYKTWSPATGFGICDAITMAGSNCSNIANQLIQPDIGILSYKFNSTANSEMYSVWTKIKQYDVSIYNLKKLSGFKISAELSTLDKLKVCVEQSTDYDSSLYEAITADEQFKYSEDFKRIAWIMLACFTIRYAIFDYATGTDDTLDTELLSDSFLDKVIQNINCEKYFLANYNGSWSEYESSPDYMSELLSKLLMNIKQLQMFVLSYIK